MNDDGILDSFIRSMPDAVQVVNDQDRFIYVSPRAGELLALDPERTLGQPTSVVRDCIQRVVELPAKLMLEFGNALGQLETLPQVEFVVTWPFRRHVRMQLFPIYDKQGNVVGRGYVTRDVTREHLLREVKTQLVANVSHELRNTIAAVRGSTGSLLEHLDGWSIETCRDFVQIIDERTKKLQELFDDTIEVSPFHSGSRSGAIVTHLDHLICQTISRAKEKWRNHQFGVDLPAELPPVIGDPNGIEYVLCALLDVIAKYLPSGKPIMVRGQLDTEQLTISVSAGDDAIYEQQGFRESQGSRAGPRTAASEPTARPSQAACGEILEAWGGRIWAGTSSGGATCLFLSLLVGPVGPGLGLEASHRNHFSRDHVTQKDREIPRAEDMGEDTAYVLVMEREPKTARFLKGTLESAGHRVAIVDDFGQAWRALAGQQPDLILMDGAATDGYEFCRELRSVSTVPVIVTLDRAEGDDTAQALDLGADDCVTRPFNGPHLLARVQAMLRRSRLPKGAGHPRSFACGQLLIDYFQRRTWLRGEEIRLTPTEYKLLAALTSNAGRLLTHEELLRHVWGPTYAQEAHYLWVRICHLRKKIEDDPRRPQYIITEPRAGYRFPVNFKG